MIQGLVGMNDIVHSQKWLVFQCITVWLVFQCVTLNST